MPWFYDTLWRVSGSLFRRYCHEPICVVATKIKMKKTKDINCVCAIASYT
jgi:hypothetical protein